MKVSLFEQVPYRYIPDDFGDHYSSVVTAPYHVVDPDRDAGVDLLRVRGTAARGAFRLRRHRGDRAQPVVLRHLAEPDPARLGRRLRARRPRGFDTGDHHARPLARQDPRAAEDRRGVRAARLHQRRPADRRLPRRAQLRREPQRRPPRDRDPRPRPRASGADPEGVDLGPGALPLERPLREVRRGEHLAAAHPAAASAGLGPRHRLAGYAAGHPPQRLRVRVPELGRAEARRAAGLRPLLGPWPRRWAATATRTGWPSSRWSPSPRPTSEPSRSTPAISCRSTATASARSPAPPWPCPATSSPPRSRPCCAAADPTGCSRGCGPRPTGTSSTAQVAIVGSPATVADQLEAFVREFRIGNLLVMLQNGSMPRALTEKNISLFAAAGTAAAAADLGRRGLGQTTGGHGSGHGGTRGRRRVPPPARRSEAEAR